MIRRPPRSTQSRSSAASDVYKRQSLQLCKTFVTPLEREDIEALSSALYKIPKTVEKFGERLLLCQQNLQGEDFSKQTKILENCTLTLVGMVKSLRRKPDLETINEQNDRLQYLDC